MGDQRSYESKELRAGTPKRDTLRDVTRAGPARFLDLQPKIGNRAVCRLVGRSMLLQKLTVGAADDRYEREADQVAGEVVRKLGAPIVADNTTDVQRAALLQWSLSSMPVGADGGPLDSATESAVQHQRGQGAPIPTTLRRSMESSFGADFSAVRLHTGQSADELNTHMQSRAFTVGNDIFFAGGQYQPGTVSGQHLLAHELTHTVQQGATVRRVPSLKVSTGAPQVVQRAGHKDAWSFSSDYRYVVKITSDTEAGIYRDADKLGIAGLIPGHIDTLTDPAQLQNYQLVRQLRAPKSGESIIVIENLARQTANTDQRPIILDAKIGFVTASGTQADIEGSSEPGWSKGKRHMVLDWWSGSSKKGYRLEEGEDFVKNAANFAKSGIPRDMGAVQVDAFGLWTALSSIVAELRPIRDDMESSKVTFVGSSALMVVFPSEPGRSTAKMIDFAHPMRQGDPKYPRFDFYRKSYVDGITNLIADLDSIKKALLKHVDTPVLEF